MSALDGSSPITAQPNDIIAAIMEYCWPLDWISARRICRRWKIIVDASIEKWSAAAGAYLFDQMTKYENCQAKIYRRWVDNAMCLYHPAVIKYHKVVPSPVEIKFVSLLNTP
ncbi:MAG: F-box protein, partial [Castellaniella sp.]